jgi:(p)ppGpp synthase/HD superfamily hydrolase
MVDLHLVEKARSYATWAHGDIGQRRKYTDEPYIVHPKAVVDILTGVNKHTTQMLCLGWLHDVVEDVPNITIDNINMAFGQELAEAMEFITDRKSPYLNRYTRKAIYRAKLSIAPDWVKTVKLADCIDNLDSIIKYDSQFAKVYVYEKQLMLPYLIGGDAQLYHRLASILQKYEDSKNG